MITTALYILIALIAALVFSALRMIWEYQRAVVFMFGRFYKVKGPGLRIVLPVIQQMVRVDTRVIVMDVPTQDVISRDNVSVKVNAVIYFRVTLEADGELQTTALDIEDGKVTAIYIVRNPEKLRHLH